MLSMYESESQLKNRGSIQSMDLSWRKKERTCCTRKGILLIDTKCSCEDKHTWHSRGRYCQQLDRGKDAK
jgi:hypothetical protein